MHGKHFPQMRELKGKDRPETVIPTVWSRLMKAFRGFLIAFWPTFPRPRVL
jgi:hypothetical protein